MGNESSHHRDPYSTNDFELVIRLAKDLEYLLTTHFSATGNGLGKFNCSKIILQFQTVEILNRLYMG